ncbi:MAG TPA: NADH-quinone oxidoreductase subunit C [Flavobacteriales bacterium]|nr:NADH-quinone oxidoreductase subunit C [Flavobacteriales bacterium]
MMTNSEIISKLEKTFPEVTFNEEESKFLIINVSKDQYYDVMKSLRNLGFDYLFSMTGMDWGKELGVTNHLENTQENFMVVVKLKLEDRDNPEIPTLENIWKTAHLHEREIYDLFGINFIGHSVMKRLLLTEDWEGYPMRKDWKDDSKMIIR